MNTEEYREEFGDIAPYTEEEALAAIGHLARHPMAPIISKYLFPKEKMDYLSKTLLSIKSVDEFQQIIMFKHVQWVIDSSVSNFTYDGLENIEGVDGKFLIISNHRDIVLDPAFTQLVLQKNGYHPTEIAVGDNLLSSKPVEYMLRCNRIIKVIRGISARELYLSSQILSKYIRHTITSGKSSVWIAQRQGRTKDGFDVTEQGLLKMLDMSGKKSFKENFEELNIIPVSISYEYEPCDIRKARETLISRTRKYVKKRNEDTHSIIMGIRQQKGNVHLHIGKPLCEAEIAAASLCDRNDRYQWIRKVISDRIVEGYRLWKTNYICYDIVNGTSKYASEYTPEDVEKFKAYTEHRLDKVEKRLERSELRDIFYRIYSNPVENKEKLYRDMAE